MKNPINHSYADHLKAAIKENDFWVKRSSEGSNSLMRAISNAIYFTEIHHEAIQNKAVAYFLGNSNKISFKFQQYKQPEALKLFIQNPSLPEFESVNLELVCMIYEARIKMYYLHEGNLCSDIHFKKAKKTFRIFRLGDNHYASIFDRAFKNEAIFCQNIIMNVLTAAVDKQKFKMEDNNNGKFLNLEYRAWQKTSGQERSNSQKNTHFNNFSFVDSILGSEKSSSYRHGDVSESSSVSKSFDYVGNEIISIFEQRKQGQQIKSVILDIEGNYDDILKSEDQNSKMKRKEEIHIFRNDLMSFSLFNEDKKTEGTGEQFYNFSAKVCGENTNLHKEVSLLKLNGIFSVGQPVSGKGDCMLGNFDPAFDEGDSLRFDNNTLDHGDIDKEVRKIKDFNERFLVDHTDKDGIFDSPEDSPMNYGLNSAVNTSNLQLNINPMSIDPFPMDNSLSNQDINFFNPSQKNKKRTLKEMYQTKKSGLSQDNFDNDSISSGKDLINNPYFQNNFAVNQPINKAVDRQVLPPTIPSVSQPSARDTVPKDKYAEMVDNNLYTGVLKFFDEKNGFGFITTTNEENPEDVFIYRNEFEKAKISMELVRTVRTGAILNFTFNIARYKGKSEKQSKKAVGIKLTN